MRYKKLLSNRESLGRYYEFDRNGEAIVEPLGFLHQTSDCFGNIVKDIIIGSIDVLVMVLMLPVAMVLVMLALLLVILYAFLKYKWNFTVVCLFVIIIKPNWFLPTSLSPFDFSDGK